MAVRSWPISVRRVTSSGSSLVTDLFTVPSDRTLIVKEIVCSQTSGSAPTTAYIYVVTSTTTVQRLEISLGGNDKPVQYATWCVLAPAWKLQLAQSSSRTLDVVISGALLFGAPA